ncbi:MAG: fibronectin type III domain-containing protein, partial [Ignavibacteriales bacterium]|nr:fibronectin type III domain-containing protein [Ignavibacteriales bacterium]
TNQQVSGLVNWLTYYWRVSATNSYGTSAYSSSWSFTTLGTPPSAPTLSTPVNIAVDVSTSPTLTWNSSTTATSYTLQVSTGSSFTNFVYNQSGLTNTNQQVSGLVNWLTYYWRVSATNSYGTSAYSSSWSFTTLGTPPSIPSLSSPSNNAADVSLSPTFTWSASSMATSYTLQVSMNNSFIGFVYNQSGLTSTSQQVSGLYNWLIYYWRVSATNSYGTSGWSNVWSFMTGSGFE